MELVMRIMHIAETVAGGIGSYFEEIAEFQISRYGAESVRFLVPCGCSEYMVGVRKDAVTEVPRTSRTCYGFVNYALSCMREVNRFAPDIIHLHSTFAGAILRPLLWARGGGRIVIYCPHGWAFNQDGTEFTNWMYTVIERALLAVTDVVINISRTELASAYKRGFPCEKMALVRNGIARERGSVEGETVSQFNNGRIHLLFVGRHDRQKGLDWLLERVCENAFKDVTLHVVGAPILSETPIKWEGTGTEVIFYGWLPRARVFELMRGADALVMPSRWEGFGLTAVEAMRLGTPVIASNRGALPEIVLHGKTGYTFDLSNPEAFVRIISALRKDELKRLGDEAQSRFLLEFEAERMNERLHSVYANQLRLTAVSMVQPVTM